MRTGPQSDPGLVWVLGPRGMVRVGDIVTRGTGAKRYRVDGWSLIDWEVFARLRVTTLRRVYHLTVPLADLHVRQLADQRGMQ